MDREERTTVRELFDSQAFVPYWMRKAVERADGVAYEDDPVTVLRRYTALGSYVLAVRKGHDSDAY